MDEYLLNVGLIPKSASNIEISENINIDSELDKNGIKYRNQLINRLPYSFIIKNIEFFKKLPKFDDGRYTNENKEVFNRKNMLKITEYVSYDYEKYCNKYSTLENYMSLCKAINKKCINFMFSQISFELSFYNLVLKNFLDRKKRLNKNYNCTDDNVRDISDFTVRIFQFFISLK